MFLDNTASNEFPCYEGTCAKALEPWEVALKRPKWELSSLGSLGGVAGLAGLSFGGYARRILLLDDNHLQIKDKSLGQANVTMNLEDAKLFRKRNDDKTWSLYIQCPKSTSPKVHRVLYITPISMNDFVCVYLRQFTILSFILRKMWPLGTAR